MGNYDTYINGRPTEPSIAKEIQIEFTLDETEDTETSCVSPKLSGESGTCEKGKWMTHPAFQNFDVTGLWVGKFETGYQGANSAVSAQQNNNNSQNIIVKPNVYSWRGGSIGNCFQASYNYKRELDSHMMKNTEWGAVAYLSHSKYGINGEIRINNNSAYLTGYASTDTANQSGYPGTYGTTENVTLPYNTETGYKASTTGNITGIYDMSGGAWEYMTAYLEGTDLSSVNLAEDLLSMKKYFDVYSNDSTDTSYNNRILGDAVGEMGLFYRYTDSDNIYRMRGKYADQSQFISESLPLFFRGDRYNSGSLAGQFSFAGIDKAVYTTITFRIVFADFS